LSLLALVARNEIDPAGLACYHVKKEKRTSSFERQTVNEKGQIEGGLASFLEGELEDMKAFLGVQQ
jgi:hypothetical protein